VRVGDPHQQSSVRPAAGGPAITALAVLPFGSVPHGSDGDFIADGITELLISALARLRSVRVISRTSVIQLDRDLSLQDIAARLHVDGLIEGSVVISSERIRVTAGMIHARSDTHVWSHPFERHLTDILSVQADLAEAIALGIQVSLTAEERATVRGDHRQDVDAHLLYLKARFQWNHPTPHGFQESYKLFRQAIEVDGTYAPAYAGLADWYHRAWLHRVMTGGDALAEARRYALRAVSLDSRLAEAHASVANSAKYDWDFRSAQTAYRKALTLSPSYAAAHLWYANLKMILGDHESALAEIGLARACDPLSPVVLTSSATIHYCNGEYSEAVADCRHAIDLQGDFSPAHYQSGRALLEMEEYDQADAAFSAACQLRPDHPTPLSGLAIARARRGDLASARALEPRVQQLAIDQSSPLSLAELYVHLAEPERVFDYLEQAYQEHQTELIGLAVDPFFTQLRSHRHFQDLLRRIGLLQWRQKKDVSV
jgi:TolB-like protein/Tfp pilus assembly protein PilF